MSKRPAGLGGNASAFAKAFTLAFEFVGAVLLFWLLGRWIDSLLDSEPWAQVIGSVIGWIGGFLHLYYKSKGVAWEEVPGTRRPATGSTDNGVTTAGPAPHETGSGPAPSATPGVTSDRTDPPANGRRGSAFATAKGIPGGSR